MRMPELPKRAPKESPSARSSSVQPPAFITDLFKDMRDRRLIIPVVALLVAIIAAPMLLSSSAAPFVDPPPPVVDPDAAAVEPGVLAVQEVGVRDFRERLDALKRKNPFGGRFEPEAAGATTSGELVEPEEAPGPSASNFDAPTVSSPSPSPQAPEPTGPVTPAESFVLVPRVNVEVGVVDRERRQTIESVESGDLLPSKQTPAAMFLGNTDDSEFAEFLISRDVEGVNGEGECKPGKNNCEFLRLADGESVYLRFADGKRYVITVKEIFFNRINADEFNQQG